MQEQSTPEPSTVLPFQTRTFKLFEIHEQGLIMDVLTGITSRRDLQAGIDQYPLDPFLFQDSNLGEGWRAIAKWAADNPGIEIDLSEIMRLIPPLAKDKIVKIFDDYTGEVEALASSRMSLLAQDQEERRKRLALVEAGAALREGRIDDYKAAVEKAQDKPDTSKPIYQVATDVETTEVEYLDIEGFENRILKTGVVEIQGATGSGKTSFCAHLASALSQNGGRVFFWSNEMMRDRIKPKLVAEGADLSQIDLSDGDLWHSRDGIARFAQYIDDRKPALVILEPAKAMMPTTQGFDEYREGAIRAVIEPYQKMALSKGFALVLLQHPKKSDARVETNTIESTHGSGAWGNVVDTGFAIQTKEDDFGTRRWMNCTKHRYLDKAEIKGVGFKIADEGNGAKVSILEGEIQEQKATESSYESNLQPSTKDKVIAWLREVNDWQTANQVADAINKPVSTMQKTLRSLAKDFVIEAKQDEGESHVKMYRVPELIGFED